MTKIESDHSVQNWRRYRVHKTFIFFKMKSLMPWIMQTAVMPSASAPSTQSTNAPSTQRETYTHTSSQIEQALGWMGLVIAPSTQRETVTHTLSHSEQALGWTGSAISSRKAASFPPQRCWSVWGVCQQLKPMHPAATSAYRTHIQHAVRSWRLGRSMLWDAHSALDSLWYNCSGHWEWRTGIRNKKLCNTSFAPIYFDT